jgi:hypothetical protein
MWYFIVSFYQIIREHTLEYSNMCSYRHENLNPEWNGLDLKIMDCYVEL